MSVSPAANTFGSTSYRKRMIIGSVGSLGRSFGGSLGRGIHDFNHYGFIARSPAMHSPAGDQAHFAMLEDKYCKDFACCGLNLENLHDLLQHFEECHVHIESEDEDDDLPFDLDEMDTDMSDGESIPAIKSQLEIAALNQGFGTSSVNLGDVYNDDIRSAFDVRKRFHGISAALQKSKQNQNDQLPATIPYVFEAPTQVLSDGEMDDVMSPTNGDGNQFPLSRGPEVHVISDEEETPEPLFSLPLPPGFDPNMLDQFPKMILPDGGDIDDGKDKDDRPYKCKIAGCTKAYKNPGGLKYHMQHGHCEDTGDPEMNNIIHKPYQWYIIAIFLNVLY
ncbi:hypothetical protein HK098_007238 [Nowakowskiella sp. JEL0407]|nr:hypothetical protein HK098_007238 [Nowakowskiella sp. JEL0407]